MSVAAAKKERLSSFFCSHHSSSKNDSIRLGLYLLYHLDEVGIFFQKTLDSSVFKICTDESL